MPSPNAVFTELVTTTLREHPNEIADNVSRNNALHLYLKKRKNILKEVDGGTEIVEPLDYAENANYQRYNGLEPLSIAESDVLSAAKFDWVQAAVNVVAAGRDIRINKGKNRIINLMKARTKNAMRTAANNQSLDMYSSGALTNQMGGLAHLIQTNGLGTVGGINAANYAFWANQFKEAAGTGPSYTDLKADMMDLWMLCVRGTDKVDLIVSTHDLYKVYWDQLSDQQRYRQSDGSVPDTFQQLKFQSADVIFDNNDNFTTTGERMYFLNTEYIKLRYHPDANWTPLEEKSSVNQDGVVVPIIWQGNMTTSNRARQGILFDAT